MHGILPFLRCGGSRITCASFTGKISIKARRHRYITCQCTVANGLSLGITRSTTFCVINWLPIDGALFTVNVAAFDVADPQLLVNTARYLYPFCKAAVKKVNVGFVSP